MLTIVVPLLISPLAASPINLLSSIENSLAQARRSLQTSNIYRIEFTSPTASDQMIQASVLGGFAGGAVVVPMSNIVITTSGSNKVAEVTPPTGQTAQSLYNTFASAMTTTLASPTGSSSVLICAVPSGTACSSGGGGGGGSPSNDDPCFPATATVTREDGSSTPVHALKVGDRIVTTTSSGTLNVDQVSRFSLAYPNLASSFVTLKTKDATLHLTDMHHIPAGPSCCSNLKRAKDVAVGETIFVVQGDEAVGQTVTEVGSTHASGKFSPVMLHGSYPVVDGVVTSFDSLVGVRVASIGLSAVEALCTATDTCAAVEKVMKAISGATSPKYLEPSTSFANSLLLVLATGAVAVAAHVRK